jgi:hypothetical protein
MNSPLFMPSEFFCRYHGGPDPFSIHKQCQYRERNDNLCYVVVFVRNFVFNDKAGFNQEALGRDSGRVTSFPMRKQLRT